MKHAWLSALLNFFFMGLGTLYNGKRTLLGLVLTAGAISLTYVEFSIKESISNLYWIMFATVFAMNLAFAADGYREAKSINRTRAG